VQVDGPQWKMQRKLIGTCFTEQNNEVVWSESTVLARDMIQYWASKPSVDSIAPDTRTLSLHVLSRAGFGKSFKFKGHDDRQKNQTSTNYKESLQLILENCILIMALGPKFLADWKPWLPRKLQRLQEACASFQRYMTETYEDEKKASSSSSSSMPGDHNLMKSLVRASQDEAKTSSGALGPGLTEQEIYGNMFVLNFAGHDTTAHTFTFSLYFLAAHREVQDWVFEELRHVLGNRPPNEWHYASDFPRLKRALAVMYETLRLYTPVPVAKWTGAQSQTLSVGDKTLILPPNTMVIPSYSAVHTDPKHWGSDSLDWKPSRWVTPGASGAMDDEVFLAPKKGTFLGWSEGARDCPGRKFSQVEFVATMAVLFREWYVEPVLLDVDRGSLRAACKRVLNQIETDSAMVLLLQMLHPERAPLVWKTR
jgi:cytochrome P450